jgi:hypothetical protein
LTLGAAPILDRTDAQTIAKNFEQRGPVVGNDDRATVYLQPE